MDGERLALLERAAVEVMSPPSEVTAEQRRKAEAAFLELRGSKLPYDVCKYILENSRSEYVLFQSASTLHEAVIREWVVLPVEDRDALRAYLLRYLTTRPGLVGYVREQLLHAVAVMVKRASLDTGRDKLFDSVFSTVAQLFAAEELKVRLLGCSLLSALLTEYSNSSGSSRIGQPMEFHVRCKMAIQGKELLRILLFAVELLQQYLSPSLDWASLSQDHISLLSSLLHLTSQVLHWDFQHSVLNLSMDLVSSEIQPVKLKPPKLYASTFLGPSFLGVFFELLRRVRASEDHTHLVVQCLMQLASLSKPVFAGEQEEETYMVNFTSEILSYVASSPDLTQYEMYGLSSILRRLTSTFPVQCLKALGTQRMEAFACSVKDLTVLATQRTVQEEEAHEDSLLYQETLEHFLEVWVDVLDSGCFSPPLLQSPCTEVFNAFILSKLVAPIGWRRPGLGDEDEILELVEDDRTAFADQLCSVGCIARHVPDQSLSSLSSLILQRGLQWAEALGVIQSSPAKVLEQKEKLDCVFEDLHWLTLIVGFTLCEDVEVASAPIPHCLMQFSILAQSETESDVTISEIIHAKGNCSGSSDGNMGSKVDPIVDLAATVLLLCEVEGLYLSQGYGDLLSPQLAETIVWCLCCLSGPYLMMEESSYEQLSLPLLSVFGRDSPSAHWLLSSFLQKVFQNLQEWSGEASLTHTTILLLKTIAKSPLRASAALQSECLWTLMRGFSSGQQPFGTLPWSAQRELMGGLVECCGGEKKGQFLAELLQPLQHRFMSLVQSPDFHSRYQNGEVQHSLLSILAVLCGLAESTQPNKDLDFFTFLLPFLHMAVSLLELYVDDPEVVREILTLYWLVAANYTATLNQAQVSQLCQASLGLIQTYARGNTGKYSKLALAEEEQCEDLLLFMKTLASLSSKELATLGSDNSGRGTVQPVDVVITGVSVLLPLMNKEILKFPSLCEEFYSLISFTFTVFPERVAVLPEQLFRTTVQLLDIGITDYGPDVCFSALKSVGSLAAHYGSTPHLHSSHIITQSLQHLLKVLFEYLLESFFNMDLITQASSALFALICTQQHYYSSLVETLVSSQTDPHIQAQLSEAVKRLTPLSLPLNLSAHSRRQFEKNLTEFLPLVKGLLYFK